MSNPTPCAMCDWEAADTRNEAEYQEALASWGEQVTVGVAGGSVKFGRMSRRDRCRERVQRAVVSNLSHEHGGVIDDRVGEEDLMSDEQDCGELCDILGQFNGIIPGEYVAEDDEAGEGTVELQVAAQNPDDSETCSEVTEGMGSSMCVIGNQTVSVPTHALNPRAVEFRPRPRIPMKYSPDVQRNIQLHSIIKSSGLPNFKGCRIPVKSAINVDTVRELAGGFPDQEAIDFLEFGFPISFEGVVQQTSPPGNHRGARDFPEAIDRYVARECELGATLGPFDHNPLGDVLLALSPLNSVPKSETTERRIILDLSFPPGRGVNDGIEKNSFLGQPFKLQLSGTDDMVDLIHQKGSGCSLFKRDLSRAFRQFPVDPADLDKLGFEWRGKVFLDRVLAMGLRTAGIACQRATNIIVYICKQNGVEILNYFDDLAGAETQVRAHRAFEFLGELLTKLGFAESANKACAPATRMVFLGILFDTIQMVMEVTPERVSDTLEEVKKWETKETTSRKELQVLLGKLHFVCKCVRQGRVFVSRLLNLLRATSEQGVIRVSEEARADIRWFARFLPEFNGVSLIPEARWSEPDTVFATDACLTGCGGVCGDEYFQSEFPAAISQSALHISALEMLTVILAVKVWGRRLERAKIRLFCDNEATVQVINSGKTRDVFMQCCLREICYLTAEAQCVVRAVHLPGVQNRLPDLLSRWSLSPKAQDEFRELTSHRDMTNIIIHEHLFFFSHDW